MVMKRNVLILVSMLTPVCVIVKSVEIERMNIMVEEKNKAISTLADGNEDERNELKKLRGRIKELERRTEEQEEREIKLRR